ncbi:hypothetical protein E4T56_gene2630 [Termitomyces sp. T112]|nr:hypothetical protein E4T56_gene2630 [Termitomyces sp. T112]
MSDVISDDQGGRNQLQVQAMGAPAIEPEPVPEVSLGQGEEDEHEDGGRTRRYFGIQRMFAFWEGFGMVL